MIEAGGGQPPPALIKIFLGSEFSMDNTFDLPVMSLYGDALNFGASTTASSAASPTNNETWNLGSLGSSLISGVTSLGGAFYTSQAAQANAQAQSNLAQANTQSMLSSNTTKIVLIGLLVAGGVLAFYMLRKR